MDDGVRVRLRGTVAIYPASSTFQMVMVGIDPTFTLGSLAAERAALLGRLENEGLIGANAARPLNPLPLRVTLIASRGSAAEADFLHELEPADWAFKSEASTPGCRVSTPPRNWPRRFRSQARALLMRWC